MLGAGVAIGLAFPLFALLFVEPRGTVPFIAFWCGCIAAGLSLGFVCYVFSVRTTEREIAAVLDRAQTQLGGSLPLDADLDTLTGQADALFAGTADLLARVRKVNHEIRELAAEVLAATEQQASGAAEQAAAVTQTSATVEELAQASRQIADSSAAVAAVAERTLASAEEGMRAVTDTAEGIEEIRGSTQVASDRILALGERSQEIGRVLTIIDDIAEQTKILALNAAIEAARAGKAGRGFAVVAEEIRGLADSVTDSTSEIGRVVREIQSSTSSLVMSNERATGKVEEGKVLALRTAGSLDGIVQQVEDTTDAARRISVATQQQRTASDQVVVSMREIAQVATQAAQAAMHVQGAMSELDRLADSLEVH
jgi:methyl-accepting chemotaxis protein